MAALSSTNVSAFTPSLSSNLERLEFSKEIQNDTELFFLINVMLDATSAQLKRFEDLYIYDELEKGEIFEKLSEQIVNLSVNEAIDLVKILAKHSNYRKVYLRLHKVCQGHLNERIKIRQPFRSQDHTDKVEQKLLNEWKLKKEIKPMSIQIRQYVYRNLFYTKKFCDFYISYTHIDNAQSCSHPFVKLQTTCDQYLESILERFEAKINQYGLDPKVEWGVLAKRIFGKNLKLTN